MSLNRYAKKRDANEGEIVRTLRKAGVHVYLLDTPVDLLCKWAGLWSVLEVKVPGGKLTPNQKKFIEQHPETPVVECPEEALRALGVI